MGVIKMRSLAEWQGGSEQERRLLLECRVAAQAIEPTAEVILFGSRARGDSKDQSDYDILVLVSRLTPALERELCRALYSLERVTDTVLSVQVYERLQWHARLRQATPFYQNVDQDGIRL